MKDAHKIGITIFIGGLLGIAVAFYIAPITITKVLLGALTGFATGYIAYEFRTVLSKVPIAWAKAMKGKDNVIGWFGKKHPYIYPIAAITIILSCIFTLLSFIFIIEKTRTFGDNIVIFGVLPSLFFTLSLSVSMVLYSIMIILPVEKGEKILRYIIEGQYSGENLQKKIDERYKVLPLTYGNVYRLAWASYKEGFRKIRKKAPSIAKKCRKAIWAIFRFFILLGWLVLLINFGCHLLKLIHSKERVLCGTYAAICVLVASYFAVKTDSPLILLAFMGATIGACLGVVAYKLISVKILKINTA